MLHGYCIRSSGDPLPPEGLIGVGGAPIRVLASGSLAVWVSAAATGPVTVDRLREHERVVRAALATATPLPLRFGSRFADELEALEVLDRRRAEFEAGLQRVENRVEMGVRVRSGDLSRGAADGVSRSEAGEDVAFRTSDAPGTGEALGAGDAARGGDIALSGAPGGIATAGPGHEYLIRRKLALEAREKARREAEDTLREIADFLASDRFQATYTVLADGDLLGTVAHLVHKADLRHYKQRLAELRRSRPDLRLDGSGPWAPYSFV